MAKRNSNTLSLLTWILGLLGCAGYINSYGFFPLLIPLLFILFGNKFTQDHCRTYFNVLLTAFVLHIIGTVIDKVLGTVKLGFFHFTYVAGLYLAIMCIFGLFKALEHKKFRSDLMIHLF